MGVSENVVYPIVPNGFADHYPVFKRAISLGRLIQHFQTNPNISWTLVPVKNPGHFRSFETCGSWSSKLRFKTSYSGRCLVSVEPRWGTTMIHYGIMALFEHIPILPNHHLRQTFFVDFPMLREIQPIMLSGRGRGLSHSTITSNFQASKHSASSVQWKEVPYNRLAVRGARKWNSVILEGVVAKFEEHSRCRWNVFPCFSVLSLLKAHQQPQQRSRKRKEMRQMGMGQN